MKIAIITGASSGMGREFVLQMDGRFDSIDEFWLISRREEELATLASGLVHKSRIFAMDVTKAGQLQRLETAIKLESATVCMLINCAGYGMMGRFEEVPLKDTLGMIRLNCEALTEITKRTIPYMAKNARIIMLASSAAFLPQADFAVYAASKSYVLSLSRALNQELRGKGISVTAVCPGPVDTPFFERAEQYGQTLALKKFVMASPEKVVQKALRDAYFKKQVSTYGLPMKAFGLASKALPHSLLLSVTELLKGKE